MFCSYFYAINSCLLFELITDLYLFMASFLYYFSFSLTLFFYSSFYLISFYFSSLTFYYFYLRISSSFFKSAYFLLYSYYIFNLRFCSLTFRALFILSMNYLCSAGGGDNSACLDLLSSFSSSSFLDGLAFNLSRSLLS